jgi:hypothetical protein
LLKDILTNYVIPLSIETKDRWLLGTAFWLLGQTHDAIRSIVVPLSQIKLPSVSKSGPSSRTSISTRTAPTDNTATITAEEETDSAAIVNDPTLFILYQHFKSNALQSHKAPGIPMELEYLFSLQVAHAYERLGCSLLSLYVLNRYTKKPISPAPSSTGTTTTNETTATATTKGNGVSRAADLFADDDDDFATPAKRSMAVDIFADDDIFASKPNDPDDIFAEMNTPTYNPFGIDEDHIGELKAATSSDIFANSMDDDHDEGCQVDDGDNEELQSYKILLTVRLLQVKKESWSEKIGMN